MPQRLGVQAKRVRWQGDWQLWRQKSLESVRIRPVSRRFLVRQDTAEPGCAADRFQRPLMRRSRFQRRLKPGVG